MRHVISKISVGRRKVRIAIGTLIVLSVPVVVYYTFYVRHQTAYFTSRDFRKLALISDHISGKVGGLSIAFKNAGEKFVRLNDENSNTSNADSGNPPNQTTASQSEDGQYDPKADREKNRKAMQANLANLKDDGLDLNATDFKDSDHAPIDLTKEYKSTVTFAVKSEDAGVWLYLCWRYVTDDKSKTIEISARTDFNKLMMPLVADQNTENQKAVFGENEFDDVLIAEASSDAPVIFQRDTSEFQLVSLSKVAPSNGDNKVDLTANDTISNVTEVNLGGSSVKIFLHPLNLTVTSERGAQNPRWLVCGIVSADRFRKEAWSISYTVLIIFAFILALAVLSWPFLKLLLIGPKDRLRTADTYLLSFSILIAVSLTTFATLYFYSYRRLEARMDKQLGVLSDEPQLDKQLVPLSDSVKNNFQTEVDSALQQLDSLDDNLRKRLEKKEPALNKVSNESNLKKEQESVLSEASKQSNLSNRGRVLPEILSETTQPYPYFDSAVWIDPKGFQRIKWMAIKDNTTQFIDVSSRPYFTKLKQNNYLSDGGGHKFWLEPIVSRTTGRNEVEISQRSKLNSDWIIALDARLMSVMEPVLPSGYGYVIVDTDGKVLFHSDENHLGENFFQECDNDPYLIGAVADRAQMHLTIGYLGRGHSAFVTPIYNFPSWSLIVFRDKRVFRTVFMDVLTLAGLMYLVYALILLTALSIFYLFNINTTERRSWLWPSPDKTLSYCISTLVILGLSAICALLVEEIQGPWCLVMISLISMAGITFLFLNLKYDLFAGRFKTIRESSLLKEAGRKSIFRYDRAYSLNLSCLLLLAAVVPSAAFFKLAYESEVELFIKHGQVTIANGLSERAHRVQSRYAEVKDLPPLFVSNTLDRQPPWDVYDGFFFDTTTAPGDSGRRVADSTWWILSYLRRNMPRPNRISIESRNLMDHPFTDNSRYWTAPEPPQTTTRLQVANTSGATGPYSLTTNLPEFGTPRIWWWPVFGVGLMLFFLWLHLIVRKIFLLDVHKPASSSLTNLLAEQTKNNLFIVLDVPYTDTACLSNSQYHQIDLTGVVGRANWVDTFDWDHLPKDTSRAIAVNHFEYRLDDPGTNRQKTNFLERLLVRPQRIIVLSTADPTRYRFVKDGGKKAALLGGSPVDGADRWSGVVSHFLQFYAEDCGDSDSFRQTVRTTWSQLLRDSTSRTQRNELRKLFNTLLDECADKAPCKISAWKSSIKPIFQR